MINLSVFIFFIRKRATIQHTLINMHLPEKKFIKTRVLLDRHRNTYFWAATLILNGVEWYGIPGSGYKQSMGTFPIAAAAGWQKNKKGTAKGEHERQEGNPSYALYQSR